MLAGSQHQPFVLAIPKNEPLWWRKPHYTRADIIASSLTADDWEKQSAGLGTKGERRYGHYLLLRRNRDEKQELAYYVVYALKEQADLKTLIQVAGHRWEIESGFEETKGECGLDHDEVRQWHSWYRHITLSLLAHAVLAVLRIQEKKRQRDW
ncbi:transposase [Xenorhabdus sp. SGI246]|uniref:transposase n=1 Tax=Xenorhabdus sp. SGI246 TaxID=3158263 RepID=UPI00349FCA2E